MTMKAFRVLASFASMAMFTQASVALASSHREAPAISNDPAADNTDLWAWVTPTTHDTLHVVASYIPLEEPSGGPNFHKFSDDVLYEIHIVRGDSSLADVITYQFRFSTTPYTHTDPASDAGIGGGKEFFAQIAGSFAQTYSVTKVVGGVSTVIGSGLAVAPPRIGPRTDTVINTVTYDDTFAATFVKALSSSAGSEGKVWAGPRDDGFYVDLGGIFDLANLRAAGVAQDGVSGYNCHTIAIDVPTTLLTATGSAPVAGGTNAAANDAQTLGVWASASRQKVAIIRGDGTTTHAGPWTQVSRLGLPLINEAVIGLQDKDKYNRTTPATDIANFAAYFLNPVIVKDAEAVGIYAALGVTNPQQYESGRLDIVDDINLTNFSATGSHAIPLTATGDVLRVDMGFDSAFPNGRSIPGGANANQEQANVTDVLLSILLTKNTSGVSNNVPHNDANYLAAIPYLAIPWRGWDQGHGKIPQ
jgi:hypothetical protein